MAECTLEWVAEKILEKLNIEQPIDSVDISCDLNVPHQLVVGAIKSLENYGEVVNVQPVTHKSVELTDEGKGIVKNGSHEAVLWNRVPESGIALNEIMKVPNAKVGFSKAMSAGWIRLDKSVGPKPIVFRKIQTIEDEVQKALGELEKMNLNAISDETKSELKKRKLINETVSTSFQLSRGDTFTTVLQKPEADLTAELLADDLWKTRQFKPYNFNSLGVVPTKGHLHPLLQMRSEFRQIFLEMGFTEMKTNQFVESSFWNFDALFQPQQHPARDAQDTFFISDPKLTTKFPEEYLRRVEAVHSDGFNFRYKYKWKREEAQKNILRTHTTAVSARVLYQLAQEKPFKPAKYFSIDRVFRNETLDATHLAEFHQIEGVVADRDLSLGHLIGILHEFFRKLGIEKLRFKPAYNPYTEPSMEVFSYHEHLKKWVEVGNSGMFRPEVLQPMGLPPEVSVIAWGLSLERPTMIKYGISNIRDLIGPRVDLKLLATAPICQLSE